MATQSPQIGNPAGAGEAPKYGIGAIAVGMQVIDILASAGAPMKLKDIAAAAGMPAAKVHRYLASFVAAGMVSQRDRSGAYDLGPMALRVGVAALRRNDVLERACANLANLRDRARATCFVCGWCDRGPLILRLQDSQRPLSVIARLGSTMPLLTSATGRVMLAYLPRSQTAPLLEAEKAAAAKPVSAAAIDRMVAETRAAGMSGGDGDFQAGIAALAVPLFDTLGGTVGTVTAIGPRDEFEAAQDGPIARELRRYAEDATAAA